MRSKAHLQSHPLHPMLIPFPLAFFTGTLMADLAGYLVDKPALWQTGFYLGIAGVGFGLLAAVPGLIDYRYTVPPHSSAKKRAMRHGILNTTTVLLFLGAWFYRQREDAVPLVVLAMETLGVALMMIAGWLGGTLVYRNQIGVDVRYAHAGKWNETYLEDTTTPIVVAEKGELEINAMKLLHIGNKRIVLARTENGFVAFDDRCPHKGGSLAGGSMMCGTVQCPWHGSQFNVTDGAVTAGPAKTNINTYSVSFDQEKVYLHLGDT